MVKIKDMPIVMAFAEKLEAEPFRKLMEAERARQIEKDEAKEKEKNEEFGNAIIAEGLRQTGKLGDEFVKFFAFYKGISKEEAEETDAIEAVSEICSDSSMIRFFVLALRKK